MTPYGGTFGEASALALAGDAHIIRMGDSVHADTRNFTPAHTWNLRIVYPHLRWSYMVAAGGSTGAVNFSFCGSLAGASRTITTYGDAARTVTDIGGAGPKLIRPTRNIAFSGDIASGTLLSAANYTGGITIQRAFSASANSATNQLYSWPKHGANSRPWFHDSAAGDAYIKGKLIVGMQSATQCEQFAIHLKRWGVTLANADVSANLECTIPTPADGAYAETEWTAVVADDGDYHATAGDQYNDHALQIGIATAAAAYNETGLSLNLVAGVFARCNSGGTIATNARGAACGYDAFGRSGSYVGDWSDNYATQDQWQQYFTCTVKNPLAITVMDIELGRNVNTTGSAEATGGTVNAGWTTNYQAFITKLQAAYAAAFPTGILYINLKMPPICTDADNGVFTTARCDAMQDRIIALSNSNPRVGWASFYEYFNHADPIEQLHPMDDIDGIKIATADRDMMDRATNFRYSTLGMAGGSSAPRNRS